MSPFCLQEGANVEYLDVTLMDSMGGQEMSHPSGRDHRVSENRGLVGEHQQFTKMDKGPPGFQTADHAKVVLMPVQVGEKG